MRLMRKTLHTGVQVLEQEEHTVTLKQAARASAEARRTRLRPVSRRDLRYYVRRLLRVEEFCRIPLRSMKPKHCRELFQKAFPIINNGYVKARAVLHSIFAYGIRREWCDTNPSVELMCAVKGKDHRAPFSGIHRETVGTGEGK